MPCVMVDFAICHNLFYIPLDEFGGCDGGKGIYCFWLTLYNGSYYFN